MGKLGTIFGVVAALLAIAAAVLSFMISGKRALYEDRASKLADTVVQMVDKLDQNSNSGAKAAISFTVAEGQKNGGPDDSLGWKKYVADPAAFDGNLSQAVGLALKLNGQRDSLAQSLADTSTKLGMDLDAKELRDLSSETGFGTAITSVTGHVEAVSARDKAMVDALVKAAGTINHPLDAAVLSKREDTTDADGKAAKGPFPCVAPLEEFSTNVKGLATRANDYAEAIVNAIRGVTKHTWQADPEKVKDEREYSGVLTSLQNDFTDINEQLALYEQAKKEVAEQKARISQLVEASEETAAELKDVKKDLTTAKKKITQLERIAGIVPGGKEGPPADLSGEVVEVNDQWNFVVLNLGRVNRVPENLKMLVARGDKLVARLQISKVMGKISVAEILPEANIELVKVGDRVIMPKEQEE